jgi:hypothetical protein
MNGPDLTAVDDHLSRGSGRYECGFPENGFLPFLDGTGESRGCTSITRIHSALPVAAPTSDSIVPIRSTIILVLIARCLLGPLSPKLVPAEDEEMLSRPVP